MKQHIAADSEMTLQRIATGMHLAPEFGCPCRLLEADGFTVHRRVGMLLSLNTPVGIAKSMGLGLIGFADALQKLAPDVMVVLGDRFEMLAAVAAALPARIPVAHIHGGEITIGAPDIIDEAIRHSIIKMSHLHFTSTAEYRQRVIQLGEHPDRVFHVGAIGIENIGNLKLPDRAQLAQESGLATEKFAAPPSIYCRFFPPLPFHSMTPDISLTACSAIICTPTGCCGWWQW